MVNENQALRRIGRYELGEQLEEGIAGSLYRARDTETDVSALVKVVSPLVSRNPAFGRYFYDKWAERKALVEHPNVLEPLEMGKEGDLYYVAVEDVGGVRLSERLKDAPLPTDEAVEIIRQTAEGLRAIHRREAVHAHLKPTDVILTTDQMGRMLVKVVFVDLGVSAAESMVSIFGETHGTPKYMAPEVIQGRSAGPEADAFALGVIAYELATAKEPFPSEHAVGYLFANCQKEAAPADGANEDVPHELALVIARLLEKDPARRYRNMQRVIDDLDRCVQSIKTGHAESVPYGTDSAFARQYEVTEPKPAAPGKGRLDRKAVIVAAVVVVVGVLCYLAGGGGGPASTDDPSDVAQRAGQAAQPAPPRGSRTPVPSAAPERELAARAALDDALDRDRERYSARGEFELGVAAFAVVAREYADTAVAARCREQMARVYSEWAASLASSGDYAGAVEKHTQAAEAAPEGPEYGRLAQLKLPSALANLANSLAARGRFDQALAVYERIERDHPGTKEAALLGAKKPEILFNQGFALWKDSGEFEKALGTLLALVRDYPNSEWAAQAKQALPSLYLDGARRKLDVGLPGEARQQLVDLTEAYPDHEVAAKAAELDAEILHSLMTAADGAGQSAQSNLHWAALLRRYPASRWTVEAAKVRLGVPDSGGALYDSRTARRQMADARQRYEQFDFRGALGTLKGLLQYAQPDSPDAADALSLYCQWLYESALHTRGRGTQQEAEATLADVSSLFAGSKWAERADRTLQRIKEPPQEGMVYVPEGRFKMGTEIDAMADLVRQYAPQRLAVDVEELWMFAELSGLLAETPQQVRTGKAFFIDRTEVTNGQYKQYVDATGAPPPSHWPGGVCPADQEELPVVSVSLAEARAYARWRGCRLPDEAEWEKAARGVDGRRFPWGNVFDEKKCNHMRPQSAGLMAAESYPGWGSPYGCLGMIGNAREWTTSPVAPYAGSDWDPGAETEGMVVARGGAWFQDEMAPVPVRCASRYWLDPRSPEAATGFRCVLDVEEPEASPAPTPAP